MLFNFQNVSAYRTTTLALNKISFTIESGQHTVILGPNGAGKSTLLKLLYRELYPTLEGNGCMELFGRSRWNVWQLRDRMGIVSLDLQRRYNSEVVGRDVVLSGFFSTIGNVREDELTEKHMDVFNSVVAELQLETLLEKRFRYLSTGQQRRCLLGRSLVNDPEALVLDEPTAGLDVPSMFRYFDTAKKLITSGKTIVLVTHHVHEIPPEIDNVILLKNGQVFKQGDKQTLLTEVTLCELFDVNLCLTQQNGHYSISPK